VNKAISRGFLRKLISQSAGALQELYAFRGIRLGQVSEFVQAGGGISAYQARTPPAEIFGKSTFVWRGPINGRVTRRRGPVFAENGEPEMSFDRLRTASEEGEYPGTDFLFGVVATDLPTETDVAQYADSCQRSTGGTGKFIQRARTQTTSGLAGSRASEEWTFSIYVGRDYANNPDDAWDIRRKQTKTIQLQIRLGNGSESSSVNVIGIWAPWQTWARIEMSKTFSGSPSDTEIQVSIYEDDDSLLMTGAQLELAAAATGLEVTHGASVGTVNQLQASNRPVRDEYGWGERVGTATRALNVAAGPFPLIAAPSPGEMVFCGGDAGGGLPDGKLSLKPENVAAVGATATKCTVNTATDSHSQITTGSFTHAQWYVFSVWARAYSSSDPQSLTMKVEIRDSVPTVFQTVTLVHPLTDAWRRIWVAVQYDSGLGTANDLVVTVRNDSGVNGAFHVWEHQLEEIGSGLDKMKIPHDLQSTDGAAAGINRLLRSNDLSLVWTLTSAIVADDFDNPIRAFTPFHDQASTNTTQDANANLPDKEYTDQVGIEESSFGSKDSYYGRVMSYGAYGSRNLLSDFCDFDNDNLLGRPIADQALQNWAPAGSFGDAWTGGVPYGFDTIVTTGGTIVKDNGAGRNSGPGALFTRTTSGELSLRRENADSMAMRAGYWYKITVWIRSDIALASAFAIRMKNDAETDQFLQTDGTWSSSATNAATYDVTTSWVQHILWFQVPYDHAANPDNYTVRFIYASATNGEIEADDFEIDGPFTHDHSPIMTNGEFDLDSEGGAPTDWQRTETGGTVQAKAAAARTGARGLELDRTGASTLNAYRDNLLVAPAKWYRVAFWYKSDIAKTDGLELRIDIDNSATQQFLTSDGETWQTGVTTYALLSPSTSWQLFEGWVKTPDAITNTDEFRPIFRSVDGLGNFAIYLDDIEIDGPFANNTTAVRDKETTRLDTFGSYTAYHIDRDGPRFWEQEGLRDGALRVRRGSGWTNSGGGNNTVTHPEHYIRVASGVTLAAGEWHTLFARLAGLGVDDQVMVRISTAGTYLDFDCTTFSATERWVSIENGRSSGINLPGWGAGVLHFLSDGAGTYDIDLVVWTRTTLGTDWAGTDVSIDDIQLWAGGGQLHPDYDSAHAWMIHENKGETQGLLAKMRGVVVDTPAGDAIKTTFKCRGYNKGTHLQAPRRSLKPECSWKFRGAECGYISSATVAVAGGGTGTTFTVDDTSDLEEGRTIIGGSNLSYAPATINSILSGTQFSTVETITLNDGDSVVYGDCWRTRRDCDWRTQLHRYGGAAGVAKTIEQGQTIPQSALEILLGIGPFISDPGGPNQFLTYAQYGSLLGSISNEEAFQRENVYKFLPIPLIYGFVGLYPPPVEKVWLEGVTPTLAGPTGDLPCWFYCIGEGEIDRVYSARVRDLVVSTNVNFDGVQGWFRRGLVGVDTIYTESDWQTDEAVLTGNFIHPGMKEITTQGRDFRSATGTSYSRMAYMILVSDTEFAESSAPLEDFNESTAPQVLTQIRGLKIPTYDSDGVASTPAWSNNPSWCLLDLLLNQRYGAGFPPEMIDYGSFITAAAQCDELLFGDDADTLIEFVSPFASTLVVQSINGFMAGATFDGSFIAEPGAYELFVNGASTIPPNYVNKIDPVNNLISLSPGVPIPANEPNVGDRLQQKVPRWTCNVAIDRRGPLTAALDAVMSCFPGYFYHRNGKLGLRIKKRLDTEETFEVEADSTTTHGRGMIDHILKLDRRRARQSLANVVRITYTAEGNNGPATRIVDFTDAQAGGNDYVSELPMKAIGVNTSWQARRVALAKWAHLGALSGGHSDNAKHARGFSVTTGLEGLLVERGDRIAGKPLPADSLIYGRLASSELNEDLSTTLRCSPERLYMRFDSWSPEIDVFTDHPFPVGEGGAGESGPALLVPAITITNSWSTNGKVSLEVTIGAGAAPWTGAAVMKGMYDSIGIHCGTTAIFGASEENLLIRVAPGAKTLVTVDVAEELLETELFFKAVPRGLDVVTNLDGADNFMNESNVVTVTVYKNSSEDLDPNEAQHFNPVNLVWDGDFDNDHPASFWTVDFNGGAGGSASVAASLAILTAGTGPATSSVWATFPLAITNATRKHLDPDSWVSVVLKCAYESAVPDGEVRVVLREVSGGGGWSQTLLTIAADRIPLGSGSYRGFALGEVQIDSGVPAAALEIWVECDSTNKVFCDKVGVFKGKGIHTWTPHPGEAIGVTPADGTTGDYGTAVGGGGSGSFPAGGREALSITPVEID